MYETNNKILLEITKHEKLTNKTCKSIILERKHVSS